MNPFLSQRCMRSLAICRTSLQDQNLDSAFSTVWEQLVCIHLSLSVFLITKCACITDALFYDVYTHLSDLHLADVGVDVKWSDVYIQHEDVDRWGKTREYFSVPIYRLPVGRMRAV